MDVIWIGKLTDWGLCFLLQKLVCYKEKTWINLKFMDGLTIEMLGASSKKLGFNHQKFVSNPWSRVIWSN